MEFRIYRLVDTDDVYVVDTGRAAAEQVFDTEGVHVVDIGGVHVVDPDGVLVVEATAEHVVDTEGVSLFVSCRVLFSMACRNSTSKFSCKLSEADSISLREPSMRKSAAFSSNTF
jgi:hypothetical protein